MGGPADEYSFALFRLVDSKPQLVCHLGRIMDARFRMDSFHFWKKVRSLLDQHGVEGEVRKRIENKIERTVPILPEYAQTRTSPKVVFGKPDKSKG